jgi:HTH-type transcriptional regulator / antitoxin HigA
MEYMNAVLKSVAPVWKALERTTHIGPIKNQKHYDEMVVFANALIDEIGANKKHPLNGLLYIVGECIANYDRIHYAPRPCTGVEMLRELMEANELTQSQLPEIGGQSVVSQILSGQRRLNSRQIAKLARRFAMSADAFIQEDRRSI